MDDEKELAKTVSFRGYYRELRRIPKRPIVWRRISLVDAAWPNLDPLLPSAGRLKGLLLNTTVDDISALDQFVELRELSVSEYCSGGFSLASLSRIERLGVDVGPDRMIVPGGGGGLRELSLSRASRPWVNWISSLPCLESLRLDFPNSLPDRLPESLRRLEISGVRRWDQWDALFDGPAGLRELRLTDIRGLTDLSSFAFARNLRFLWVEDCSELRSLDGPGLSGDVEVHRVGRTPR